MRSIPLQLQSGTMKKEYWINNIINDLRLLSDVKLQKENWVEKLENTDVSKSHSYSKTVRDFFDDHLIDEFLKVAKKDFRLSDQFINSLSELRNQFLSFVQSSAEKSDAEIIEDPQWQKVVTLAKQCLRALDQ